MKQTAVEWLQHEIQAEVTRFLDGEIDKMILLSFMCIAKEKAKEMEAEQIGYNKEEVDKLLDTLIQNNMCSVLGDELIEQFKNKQ